MTLRVAVTLGLPDRLRERAATAAELAAELAVSPIALDLLLEHLASLEVVARTSAGYRTTAYGTNLCASADNMADNMADNLLINLLHLNCAGGRAELAFVELLHSITTGQAAYSRRYGQDFWADLAEHPILTAHPRLHGQLVDLDPTATEAASTFAAHDLGDRAQARTGSFFDALSPGADAYLLCDILHDWDDDRASTILRRCAEAAHPTSRILVIEAVGGLRADSEFNLAMLAIFGGRDRTLDEFRDLAAPLGLTLEAVTDLTNHRCLLELVVS